MANVTKKVRTRLLSRLWKPTEISGLTINPCQEKSCDDIEVDYRKTKKLLFLGGEHGLDLNFDKKTISINANGKQPTCNHRGDVLICDFKNDDPMPNTRVPHLDDSFELIKDFTTDTLSLRSRPKVNMNEYSITSSAGILGGALSFLNPFAFIPTVPILMALWGGQLFGGVEVLDNNFRTKWILPDQTDVHEIHISPKTIKEVTFRQHPFLIKMDVKFKKPVACSINERPNTIRLDGHRRLDCGI